MITLGSRMNYWPPNMELDLSEKITVIKPSGNSFGQSLQELQENKGVMVALAFRDFRVRYAQTYLGIGWGVFQPLLGLLAVFVLFFKLAGITTGGTPYLAFALSGLIIWNYFYYLVTQSASGLVNMQAMIRKIYFPRLSIPFSKALVGSIDLLIGFILLLFVLIYFKQNLTGIWMLIPIALLTSISALGLGLIASAISLRYRDLQQIIPALMQLLFFLTPVAYPSSLLQNLVSDRFIWLTYLNPLTGILELWRWGLFGEELSFEAVVSVGSGLFLFVLGIWMFGKAERKMADVI